MYILRRNSGPYNDIVQVVETLILFRQYFVKDLMSRRASWILIPTRMIDGSTRRFSSSIIAEIVKKMSAIEPPFLRILDIIMLLYHSFLKVGEVTL